LGIIARMLQKLTKVIRETWFFWVFFLVIGFMLGTQPETSRSSLRPNWPISVSFALLVAFWVMLDARRRGRQMGYGFPALVFFVWPVFAPIYLFQTRGLWAFLSLLSFAAAIFLAFGVGGIIGLFTQS
jgi:hypothetical protein